MNQLHTAADLPPLDWLEVIKPAIRLGQVRHAVFDFDGTISVLRRGWEVIMSALMLEMICGDSHIPTPKLEAEVANYIDVSTGILTIKQMEWLESAVKRYGFVQSPKTAREYKKIYNERLLRPVQQRIQAMGDSQSARDTLTIAGARDFLHALTARGVKLYLASGTDHEYVVEESAVVGVRDLFGEHIYGAQDGPDALTKDRIIQQILDTHNLHGSELLVVGDGPVEIRHARERGAVALGIAADEDKRQGLNTHKRQRLINAGADLIVTDFLNYTALTNYLCDYPAT